MLLQHDGDGLLLVDGRLAGAAAVGVVGQGPLQLVGEPEVIDDQPAGLVLEDAVHAGDGLHQAVASHRLVHVHRVQARGVEAGQPHIADDDELEWVLGVLEAVGQALAAGLVPDVLLPVERVIGRAGHDDLHRAFVVVRMVPVGTKLLDLLVKFDADAAAHADDHRLAVHRVQPVLEVLHQVFGDQLRAAFRCRPAPPGRPIWF